ncbi:DegT/DnrJ/EryC1/StrS family aminotransferase, partial [Candidatus Roizmanbacteria bacterium]|nr:DegT/DnrJ/EryC1/StrS family aminotransferase [Candidatus Roizmanbacteria bacterium]
TQHGRSVEVTEDHSVFILDMKKAEIVAKRAKEITLDDFIVSTNNIPNIKTIKYIDLLDYFKNLNTYVSNFSQQNLKNVKNWDYRWQYKSRNSLPIKYLTYHNLNKENLLIGIPQSKKIPARIIINEELCRLIGYFIAEGSYLNGLIFSFNSKEKDLIDDVINIIKSQFNLESTIINLRDSSINIEVSSKNLEIVFREIFEIKKGAKNKRIPWFLYHTSDECVKSFVYGYTRGDGSIKILKDNTDRIDVTSVSKELLNDFQYLLSRIGISASFYRRNKANRNKLIKQAITSNYENYSLCFGGYGYKNKTIIKQNLKERNNFVDQIPLLPIFRKYISISKNQQVISKKRLKKYLDPNSKLYTLVASNLSYLKVRKIEEINYDKDQYVYDFSVPNKENFYGGFLGMFLHNTMGEGGAVITNNPLIHMAIRQFRDWGRDCWCDTGKDDTCRRRFGWKLGDLPFGYDHKYSYSQIGFNLKLTDFQAAIGVAQLKKLPYFIKKRKENFKKYYDFFNKLKTYFILLKTYPKEDPCWFGFPIVVRNGAPFSRNQLTEYLEANKIGTRNVFSGNLLKHPAYKDINCKIVGKLKNADHILNGAFWIGVFPEIDNARINYVKSIVERFLNKYS